MLKGSGAVSRRKESRNNHMRNRGKPVYRQEGHSRQTEAIGQVIAHPDGFGFARVDEKRDNDVFIPNEQMRDLLHGDRIKIRVVSRRGRTFAEVLEVLEKAPDTIIGQITIREGIGTVEPRSKHMPKAILVRAKDAGGACDGDWVRLQIHRGSHPVRGSVVEKLGDLLSPSSLIDLVISEQQLNDEFPEDVLNAAEQTPATVLRADRLGREDLTHLPFVTIDGEDARDFDDAICIVPRGQGFELWVAIADVDHYVRAGSAIDREARERGNSFYFPDRVIPMLPEILSNGICSLKPEVQRVVMAVRMRFDTGGHRRSVHISEALIYSRARLTYTQVAGYLEKHNANAIAGEEIREMLDHAAGLYRMLAKSRHRRGTIDLDLPEVRAVIAGNKVSRIEVREQTIAHRLIEECMLAANTAVACFLEEKQAPFLYRIHEPPEFEAILSLNEFLSPFGLFIPVHQGTPPYPKEFQRILEQAADKPHLHAFSKLILRSMKRACYTPDHAGHFGLAYKTYTHFTSPIRRYADLTVHRMLRMVLRNKPVDRDHGIKELEEAGRHVSIQERKQMRAEWDATAMLAALYHQKDIGREFDAIVGGVTERNLFLELQPSMAEAVVPTDALGRLHLDRKMHRLVEPYGGRGYGLGDSLRIRIESTDPVRGQIRATLLQDS